MTSSVVPWARSSQLREGQHLIWKAGTPPPINTAPTAWRARSRAMWSPHWGQPCVLCPSPVRGLSQSQPWPPCPAHTEEVSKGVSPAKELPEDIVSAAEGEGEFGSPSTGPRASWSCWRRKLRVKWSPGGNPQRSAKPQGVQTHTTSSDGAISSTALIPWLCSPTHLPP